MNAWDHLWRAQGHALYHVERGDPVKAMTDFAADLQKHPGTAQLFEQYRWLYLLELEHGGRAGARRFITWLRPLEEAS